MDTSKPTPCPGSEDTRTAKVRTIPCPGCGHRLPEDDLRAQIAHMEANHPDIIAARLNEIEQACHKDLDAYYRQIEGD